MSIDQKVLDFDGLAAGISALIECDMSGTSTTKEMVEAVIRAYLAALTPAPHGGAVGYISHEEFKRLSDGLGRAYAYPAPARPDDVPVYTSPPQEQEAVPKGGLERWTYASIQETECAQCGIRKHTPLRRDEMGGYVCLTCIDKTLDCVAAPKGEAVAWRWRHPKWVPSDYWALTLGRHANEDQALIFEPLYTAPPSHKAEPEQEAVEAERDACSEILNDICERLSDCTPASIRSAFDDAMIERDASQRAPQVQS